MTTQRVLLIATALGGNLAACTPGIDLEAEEAALRATDEAWAAAASEGADAELIASFWSDDATIYSPDEPVVQGKPAILEMVTASLAIPGFNVTWQPTEVSVSASGDVGYVVGTNEVTVPDGDGGLITTRGRYVAVWRKDGEGNWKCVIDISNSGPSEALPDAS
jgi:ketosteroid isomerase-like protein